jgi:hypothetical protein
MSRNSFDGRFSIEHRSTILEQRRDNVKHCVKKAAYRLSISFLGRLSPDILLCPKHQQDSLYDLNNLLTIIPILLL